MTPLFAAALFAVALGAQAADKAPTAQQTKMKTCNAEAKGKKGDERKAFMKECLSGGAAAAEPGSPACEKSAADKKLHGAAARSHVKKCMADAAASAPQ
ncbi:MAG: PsiF family protein [Roseateles sp.]